MHFQRILTFLKVALICLPTFYCDDIIHFITPLPNDLSCPVESCLTLRQFAASLDSFNDSNVTLYLLPGNHSLDSELLLTDLPEVSIISNITDSTTVWSSNIDCTPSARMYIYDVRTVHITGVKFINCQNITVTSVISVSIWNAFFHGSTGLYLNQTNTSIEHSMFTDGRGIVISPDISSTGGVIVIINSTTRITNSSFTHNTADIGAVIYAEQGSSVVMSQCLFQHNIARQRGGVLYARQSEAILSESHCSNNRANQGGGVMYIERDSVVNITDSNTEQNYAEEVGGVLAGYLHSVISIDNTTFNNNTSGGSGGATHVAQETVMQITNCTFEHNHAVTGGAITLVQSNLYVISSIFNNNEAAGSTQVYIVGTTTPKSGGALYAWQSNVTLGRGTIFMNNTAELFGGAILAYAYDPDLFSISSIQHIINITENVFENNRASAGGVMYAFRYKISDLGSKFQNNEARSTSANILLFGNNVPVGYGAALVAGFGLITLNGSIFVGNTNRVLGALMVQFSKLTSSGVIITHSSGVQLEVSEAYFSDTTYQNNLGSLVASNSNVTFSGKSNFTDCGQLSGLDSGGAITSYYSRIYFYGSVEVVRNYAERGGGIQATDSKLFFIDESLFADNSANRAGGAIFLSRSEMTCLRNCTFSENAANGTGGGIHSSSSTITTGSLEQALAIIQGLSDVLTSFVGNSAQNGGGIYLQSNSKLYMQLKSNIRFTDNSAYHGGAIYVADNTYFDTCSAAADCFFREIFTDSLQSTPLTTSITDPYIEFSHNSAYRGSVLFGGLLD